MVLEQVAFDIETTGFGVTDEVTVIGFAVPLGVQVFLYAPSGAQGEVEPAVREAAPVHVNVTFCESEEAVFEAVGAFVEERLGDDVLLVAYNGERWNGGFDLPFLRTRFARLDVAWPFGDVPYADVMPLVSDRFNTTIGGEERRDLESAYDALCGDGVGDVDPFAESSEAVEAFEGGEFVDVVLHNVADVLRTRALGRVAERYCSKSDFDVKSLTPTREG